MASLSRQCLVEIALGIVGVAAVPIRFGQLRLQPDGLGEVGNRLVDLAAAAIGVAPRPVGFGILRVQPDGLGGAGDGQLVLFFAGARRP